ncbi:MAG TPA: M48 family metallopeptidase [Acidimicrobiales bacterium]|nr:M48 family metallopeptidase [Acidimicrobiales bacterium]
MPYEQTTFELLTAPTPPRWRRRRRPSAPTPEVPPAGDGPEVEVRTSARRKKTATSFWQDGRIVVVLPTHVQGAERAELVRWLVARTEARRPHVRSGDELLARRAAELADRYVDGVRPRSIRWVMNQSSVWGSCTAEKGEIRVSHRLRPVPGWVLDAVVVHELAHLVHADHSPEFHALAERYPKHREAAVFLEGYALGLEGAPS